MNPIKVLTDQTDKLTDPIRTHSYASDPSDEKFCRFNVLNNIFIFYMYIDIQLD